MAHPQTAQSLRLTTLYADAAGDTVTIRIFDGDPTPEEWGAAVGLIGLGVEDTDYDYDIRYTADDTCVYTISRKDTANA